MKKTGSMTLVLVMGVPALVFAKAGNAYDGLEFILAIIGFLLLLVGILEGIDYLKKNGRALFIRAAAYYKKKITTMKENWHHLIRSYA